MSDTQTWTVKSLLEWTTDYLAKSGSDSPRLDAEVLLAHVLGWPRIQLYAQFNAEPSPDDRGRFRELIKQRARGVPVAHLIGTKEFFSIDLWVSRDVLIPRPETEFAVVRSLDLLRKMPAAANDLRCLDLGTGSGAIAIAIASQLPTLQVVASDISPLALAVARRNVTQHQLSDRIHLVESDLFAKLKLTDRFHLIVSNPPYIGQQERASLDRDVVDFEPEIALFSGERGYDCSERIIAGAADYLHPQGWLVLESSPFVIEHLAEVIRNDSRYGAPVVTKDLAGLQRIISAPRAE